MIPTERCGAVNVWVQGDLEMAHKEGKDQYCVFMTVHDVGNNHTAWLRFVNHPTMTQIRERAIFVHVDLVGQEDGAEELTTQFPTMQQIGEDLVNILDMLRIKCVIGLGEGAGANIMMRFGMMHVTRCLGIICVNPNPHQTGIMENIKEKLSNLTHHDKPLTAAQKQMNQKNVHKYLEAFQTRTDIIPQIERNLKCDTLLVAGAKDAAHVTGMEAAFANCDKTKTSMLKIDDVGANLMEEAPAKLAQSILLFVKGLGWLTSVMLPGVERRSSRDRRMSMEEYDKPNIRRLSLTGAD